MNKREKNQLDVHLKDIGRSLEDIETRTTDLETRATDLENTVEIKEITRNSTNQEFTISKETTILYLSNKNNTIYNTGSIKLKLEKTNKIYNIVDFRNDSYGQDNFNNLWWNEKDKVVIQEFTYFDKNNQILERGTPNIITSPLIQLYTPDNKKIYILNIPTVG